ncbi:MAG: hypothetical protein Q4B50_02715 [Bacillota bacterium]|nr:hypothetical protein [Bacillota bacterium]
MRDIGIIGGADGPTSILLSVPGDLSGWLWLLIPLLALLLGGICGYLWKKKRRG